MQNTEKENIMLKTWDVPSIRRHFFDLHDNNCAQKYDKRLPYSFHLEMVAKQAKKFEKFIPSDNPYYLSVWVGIYGHDAIEDARVTYNDIRNLFGGIAAEIIYLCTEDKGRNRSERKSDAWYEELKTNDLAVFVKLCDIIANIKYSLLTNSSMFGKYRDEYYSKVRPHLYTNEYSEIFDYIDSILTIKQ
jgi:(p)ppGpp synthase/HD superfamily hydrolase